MLDFAGVRAMLPKRCRCCRPVTVSSPPCTRPRAKGRGVGRKVIGTVVVFDPGAKPLGCMGQSIRLEPVGVLIEWLVQMFRSEEWDVAVLDREGVEGTLGRAVRRTIRYRAEASPVRSAPDLQWIRSGYSQCSSRSISESSSRRVGRRVAPQGQVVVGDVTLAGGPHFGLVPRIGRPASRRLRIELIWKSRIQAPSWSVG